MNQKSICLELYKEAFPERDIPFEEELFENCFKYCRYIIKNGEIVSMLFALPCEIEIKKEKYKCIYIYAAATLKRCRGKGYMGELIEGLKETRMPLLLRPSNEGLSNFYKKFGFKTVKAKKSKALPYVAPSEDFEKLIQKFPETETNQEYTAMYYSKNNINLDKINFIYTME